MPTLRFGLKVSIKILTLNLIPAFKEAYGPISGKSFCLAILHQMVDD